MGAAESRYARALFAETAEYEKTAESLDTVADCLSGSPTARFFLLNPTTGADVRRETMLRFLPEGASKTVRSFVSLLSDRKRLTLLPGIASAYKRLLTDAGEVLYINVASCYPLDDEQYRRIGQSYVKRFNAKAFVINRVTDPALLGGVRVQIGDWESDGTLRMKLNKLKELAL